MKPTGHTWAQYIRNGLGLKLSRIGEVVGVDRLIYNPVILELFHSIALENSPKVVDSLLRHFPDIKSVIDVGCGGGAFAAEFRRRGLIAIGLEYSPHGIALAIRQGVDCRPFDVARPIREQIAERADLAYSFEVAEHIPSIYADQFVDSMIELSDTIVFAAAQPGQGGIGHVNEQPIRYWIEKFEEKGFRYDEGSMQLRLQLKKAGASYWFENNTCIFRKDA